MLITLPAGVGGGSLVMDGTSLSALTTANTNLVCFCAGTQIATPDGPRVVEDLGVAFQASLLLRNAPDYVADAFCAGRLGEGGRAYGTLPTGVDARAIVDRVIA